MPDPATIEVWLNGAPVRVVEGTLASAVFLEAMTPTRLSVTGEPRSPLCGMGICFECRAKIDGIPHRRTCQVVCREGMRLESQQ